ncbi:glycosyltransferase [Erythrobacter sp. sf7]|uniref:Glycosyltransferase n=2 Tax=Erythrobacter fulvus TaxID=2987523 RepID=A0ABT5JLX2_9SPHN|nr:glycosyltransferase [Erythrobacter fulvus]
MAQFKSRYENIAVWIIDSFNHQWTPPAVSLRDIDIVAVMRPNDEANFEKIAPRRVIVLGWGSDVLGFGSGTGDKSVDILRLGRQPGEWNDDIITASLCRQAGLSFEGRPPLLDDPSENQKSVMRVLAKSRYLIAHSNLAAPAPYTHRREEYITARWTDALACGAVVAGVQPRSDRSFDRLLWSGAFLDFDRIDLKYNIAALKEARAAWRPEVASLNYRNALAKLDWRWRLRELLNSMGIDVPPILAKELVELSSHANNWGSQTT